MGNGTLVSGRGRYMTLTELPQASYQVWLGDPRGKRRDLLEGFSKLQYVRVLNDVGRWVITLPADTVDSSLLVDDAVIEIWRGRPRGRYHLQMVGFLRRPEWFDERGRDMLTLSGPDANELLTTRTIASGATLSDSRKTSTAIDDVMKAIVRENLGSDASADRDLSDLDFTVEADASAGPITSRSYPRKSVLVTLQELGRSARAQGVSVYFDIVPTPFGSSVAFEFRTFITRRGSDRRSSSPRPTVFSRERGNLEAPSLARDAGGEITYLYAGGQGEGDDREVVELSNDDRINASPWGRREGWASVATQNTTDEITATAEAILDAERPRWEFVANLKSTPQTEFDVDWTFGDSVTTEYRDQQFDGDVDRLRVTRDRQEVIEAAVESQEAATVTTFITWSTSASDRLVTEVGDPLIA
jgi:hypothetical protein